MAQAAELSQKIKEAGLHFDFIYSSPLQRAFLTAQAVSRALGSSEPVRLDELIERDFGVMTGCPVNEIETRCNPDILKTQTVTYFLSPSGAETFPQLVARAQKLLDLIRERHMDGSVLLVTHGDFGKMIYAAYYCLDWLEALKMFHFGNSELLLLAPESRAEEAHVLTLQQFNH